MLFFLASPIGNLFENEKKQLNGDKFRLVLIKQIFKIFQSYLVIVSSSSVNKSKIVKNGSYKANCS